MITFYSFAPQIPNQIQAHILTHKGNSQISPHTPPAPTTHAYILKIFDTTCIWVSVELCTDVISIYMDSGTCLHPTLLYQTIFQIGVVDYFHTISFIISIYRDSGTSLHRKVIYEKHFQIGVVCMYISSRRSDRRLTYVWSISVLYHIKSI